MGYNLHDNPRVHALVFGWYDRRSVGFSILFNVQRPKNSSDCNEQRLVCEVDAYANSAKLDKRKLARLSSETIIASTFFQSQRLCAQQSGYLQVQRLRENAQPKVIEVGKMLRITRMIKSGL